MGSKNAVALAISPHGRLFLDVRAAVGGGDAVRGRTADRIAEAFGRSLAEGLLHLASRELRTELIPSLAFGRRLGAACLTALSRCASPEEELLLSEDVVSELLASLPPMRGAEYANDAVIRHAWTAMSQQVRRELADFDGTPHEYLQHRNPAWHGIGRVTFHLAEQKNNPLLPFAFLATYAEGMQESGRARHVPLSRAIAEARGDKETLLALLRPVSAAAQRNDFIRQLVDSGDIHHPIAWTRDEAYRFLLAVPDCEASGVSVRVPNWWRSGRRRAHVGAQIGARPAAGAGIEGLLDFDVSLHVEGLELTAKERKDLLSGAAGLRLIKGQWVEVDPDRLSQALAQFETAARLADDGLTFAEGMRLLSGLPRDLDQPEDDDTQTADWVRIEAGPWLKELLDEIRDPERRAPCQPGAALKGELRPYQQEGVTWLYLLHRLGLGACLADDMGLGKTIQILAFFLVLAKERSEKTPPHLLVVPASLLGNWKSEAERFAPSLRLEIAHRSERTSRDLGAFAAGPLDGVDIVMTTYGTLSRLEDLRDRTWNTVILDEAQAIKNPSTRQTKHVKTLDGRMRIALTGTPVENRLGDLWSIFDFLNPGLLGSAGEFQTFARRLANGDPRGYGPLRTLLKPYILRRLKTDPAIVPDLPEKTEVDVFCGLSKHQALLYQQGVEELEDTIQNLDGMARRGAVLAFLTRFKQICDHPSLWLGDGIFDAKASGKFARLEELLEPIVARQEKLILFTQFREMINPLLGHMATLFGRPGIALHGGTSVRKRQQLVEQFQEEDGPPFMILSLRAGGTGLNLTEASHVVHFDRWWNPAVESQATDRAFRIGQSKNVLVHRFICRGTVEERIHRMIAAKRDMAEQLLGPSVDKSITEMDAAELIELVSLDLEHAAL